MSIQNWTDWYVGCSLAWWSHGMHNSFSIPVWTFLNKSNPNYSFLHYIEHCPQHWMVLYSGCQLQENLGFVATKGLNEICSNIALYVAIWSLLDQGLGIQDQRNLFSRCLETWDFSSGTMLVISILNWIHCICMYNVSFLMLPFTLLSLQCRIIFICLLCPIYIWLPSVFIMLSILLIIYQCLSVWVTVFAHDACLSVQYELFQTFFSCWSHAFLQS